MSENKKGPGSSLANSQGTNKSSYKLYHERNEESKMNISTAVSVLKNNLERYDEQMKMHGIMGGDLLGENPTISAMRKAVEILENIKIVCYIIYILPCSIIWILKAIFNERSLHYHN